MLTFSQRVRPWREGAYLVYSVWMWLAYEREVIECERVVRVETLRNAQNVHFALPTGLGAFYTHILCLQAHVHNILLDFAGLWIQGRTIKCQSKCLICTT